MDRALQIACLMTVTMSNVASAWGPKATDLIVDIALEHISPITRRNLNYLIPAKLNLADAVNQYHVITVGRKGDGSSRAGTPSTTGDMFCVIDSVPAGGMLGMIHPVFMRAHDDTESAAARLEALARLTRIVAELHDPLQCTAAVDDSQPSPTPRSSFNDLQPQPTMDITAWESSAELLAESDIATHGSKWRRKIDPLLIDAWTDENLLFSDWAIETHGIAITSGKRSAHIPRTSDAPKPLPRAQSDDYEKAFIQQQILKAGVRLGFVYDALFFSCTDCGEEQPARQP